MSMRADAAGRVRGPRVAPLLASVLLAPAALAVPAAGTAARTSGVAAIRPVTLLAGDGVLVAGSKLNCVASQTSGNPIALVCGEGPLGKPTPGTYAFALADSAALVLKSSPAGKPQLVAREAQPSSLPGAFPRPKSHAPRAVRLGVGRVFDVAATDIYCAVTTANKAPSVTCGLADPKTTFAVGSVAAFASGQTVFLSRLVAAGSFHRLTTVLQPKR